MTVFLATNPPPVFGCCESRGGLSLENFRRLRRRIFFSPKNLIFERFRKCWNFLIFFCSSFFLSHPSFVCLSAHQPDLKCFANSIGGIYHCENSDSCVLARSIRFGPVYESNTRPVPLVNSGFMCLRAFQDNFDQHLDWEYRTKMRRRRKFQHLQLQLMEIPFKNACFERVSLLLCTKISKFSCRPAAGKGGTLTRSIGKGGTLTLFRIWGVA